jgi:type II secretory pathway component GspD/PulD (secretin)
MTEATRFFPGDRDAALRHRRLRKLATACALLPLLLAGAVAVAQEMQVIDLHYRRADEVIPVLQPLLEPGDALTGMDDKLFVRAGPATLARVVQAIEAMDHPQRQLLITVGQGTVSEVAATDVRGAATVSSGDVSVGVNRPPGADSSAQVVVTGRRQQANMRNVSSVRAIEGMEAYVATGQEIPFNSTQVTPGWSGPVVSQSTSFRDVSTGFYATAHLSGDTVTLVISPRQQSYDRARGGTIHTAGTDSTVTARLGEWVELGAVRESRSASDSGLLVWGRHSAQSQYSAWLKVDELPTDR